MKSAAEHNAKLIAEYEEQIQVKIPLTWTEWNIQTKLQHVYCDNTFVVFLFLH